MVLSLSLAGLCLVGFQSIPRDNGGQIETYPMGVSVTYSPNSVGSLTRSIESARKKKKVTNKIDLLRCGRIIPAARITLEIQIN
jgi:hypothetical protein